MFSKQTNQNKVVATKVLSLLSVSLLLAANVGLGAHAFAKRPAFQMPSLGKLDTSTPDDTSANNSATSQKKIDLSPVTLSGDQNPGTESGVTPTVTSTGEPLLKSTVTKDAYLPKTPDALATQNSSESILSPGSRDTLKQARQVNAMPLSLMETADETGQKIDVQNGQEKVQLADLWEATLAKSPDIQFVIQKLVPTSDPGHASGVMMHMIGTALYSAMGIGTMMAPGMGTYALNSAGASLIMNTLNMVDGKRAKKAKVTQEEAIMLYNMVRTTADRLTESYRNYKKYFNALNSADQDQRDLQKMLSDARAGQDASKQLEMEYTLRKGQRDIEMIGSDVKHYRQSLVDLAGPEAVAKLDTQMDAQLALQHGNQNEDAIIATPGQVIDSSIQPANPQTASSVSPEKQM